MSGLLNINEMRGRVSTCMACRHIYAPNQTLSFLAERFLVLNCLVRTVHDIEHIRRRGTGRLLPQILYAERVSKFVEVDNGNR